MIRLFSIFFIFNSFVSISCTSSWWKNKVFYEIYPQSFYDSDDNGIGDLKGIEMKSHYLTYLNVDAVYLSPFHNSPLKDSGYDITDYKSVNPVLGTIGDFQSLLDTLQKKGIKMIMDFVPNYTSNEHEWFQKSIKREGIYSDYYIWMDPKGWDNGKPIPPNNWESMRSTSQLGSAWTWNGERKQFYYHSFLPEQPDLNLRFDHVVNELKDVLKFWMDKGVCGFRIQSAPFLIEDSQFRNNPASHVPQYTQNLPETHKLIQDIRSFLNEYPKNHCSEIFLTAEAYASDEKIAEYYGSKNKPEAHFPLNYLLLTKLNAETDAYSFDNSVNEYFSHLKANQYPNWVSGNRDWPRIPSRNGGSSSTFLVNLLSCLLPGTTFTYMGDEIGMDSFWRMDQSQISSSQVNDYRTPGRTPFQWSNERNAGFTQNPTPWLPIHPDFYRNNVQSEQESSRKTYLSEYRRLVDLKSMEAFAQGSFTSYVLSKYIYAFMREHESSWYLVLVNFSKKFSEPVDVLEKIPKLKYVYLKQIAAGSLNFNSIFDNKCTVLNALKKKYFHMPPKSAVVLEFIAGSKHGARCMD